MLTEHPTFFVTRPSFLPHLEKHTSDALIIVDCIGIANWDCDNHFCLRSSYPAYVAKLTVIVKSVGWEGNGDWIYPLHTPLPFDLLTSLCFPSWPHVSMSGNKMKSTDSAYKIFIPISNISFIFTHSLTRSVKPNQNAWANCQPRSPHTQQTNLPFYLCRRRSRAPDWKWITTSVSTPF